MGMSQSYGAPADKKEMRELIAAAVDMGITLFDTAEVYGTPDDPHDNERLVGAALAPYRDKVLLATKFGIHFDMSLLKEGKSPIVPDARPAVIRASVDASLQRLGTDHIDLFYQHRVDPKIPTEEVAGVMADLIKEGTEFPRDFHADKIIKMSAKTGEGIEDLKKTIENILQNQRVYLEHIFSYKDAGKIALIRKFGEIKSEEYTDGGISIKAYIPAEIFGKVMG